MESNAKWPNSTYILYNVWDDGFSYIHVQRYEQIGKIEKKIASRQAMEKQQLARQEV